MAQQDRYELKFRPKTDPHEPRNPKYPKGPHVLKNVAPGSIGAETPYGTHIAIQFYNFHGRDIAVLYRSDINVLTLSVAEVVFESVKNGLESGQLIEVDSPWEKPSEDSKIILT